MRGAISAALNPRANCLAAASPSPEADRRGLDDWLAKIDKLVTEMQALRSFYQNATPGTETLRVLQVALANEVARDAASRFGFTTCADTGAWTTSSA
ncbi:hypothetical protein A8924_5230 [Saccharopolyspora erythraea NRRL 2338]|uniref:Uncharacterized protein n=2 Tax=Saccharopolyspora erythraea TaxID=1836 RepID=A4FJ84_SACEN|nr:hypothetical protein [Saccharopolyspora erythraea]EQD82938.1 hypothetical protein N599_27970 [Saccharopolyspora erythraea D]PFG97780.1 hypothetical protein A8924_5230 [Saccharopolyspora erythraea NRRL 2338]QRK87923.1 hypothetical protein JQX30_24615 [Saccharopolyspora erythraea]CAM04109.1 hypothetical protein SACE_4844 [Saccharopolyspora erythraea NRRL 2338]